MMSIRLIGLVLAAVQSALFLLVQEPRTSCCTIIDIDNDSGIVVIRDIRSGWLKAFKPSALEFAELNIGDSVDASVLLQQVSRVRSVPRAYPLKDPFIGDPCCQVYELKMDSTERIVVARNREGGDVRFTLPDTLARNLAPGNNVYTSPTHGFAMFLGGYGTDSTKKLIYSFPLLPNVQDSAR